MPTTNSATENSIFQLKFILMENKGDLSIKNEPYKIVIVGDSSVGKTTFLNTFIKGKHHKDIEATIGAAFVS